MTRETDLTFECLFILEEIRQIWRDSAPKHELSPEQKKQLKGKAEKVKKNLDEIVKLKG
jgi:hypothetical protein